MDNRITLTHSAISMFRQCPRRYQHRYVDQIVPSFWQDSPALRFGTAFHEWLEAWYKGQQVSTGLFNLEPDDAARLNGAATAYAKRYSEEAWRTVYVEQGFETVVINPDTGAHSPLYWLKGKVDLVVEYEGEPWIVEHKTSTTTGVNDLDRVGIDAQVLTYADCIGRAIDTPIAGVIYNVVKRCQLRLKQKETPEEFVKRVAEWYDQPDSMLRERQRISPDMIAENRRNIWSTVQQMNMMRRDKFYAQNAGVTTGACAKWGRECEYAPLCKTMGMPSVRANYKHQEPHGELNEENDAA